MNLSYHIQVPKRVINMHEKPHACLRSFGADSGGVFDCLGFWVAGGFARVHWRIRQGTLADSPASESAQVCFQLRIFYLNP